MSSKQQHKWWDNLTDECPITLEPLSTLPYPPFILTGGKEHHTYFDGLALATYIISQGNFANPLTRAPLTYDDCVRLDEHLNQYIYQQGDMQQHAHLASLGLRGEKVSVKEAYLLRDSIKVKVGNTQNESDLRRAEVLRNEAASALRGLFVFGHSNRSENVNVGQASSTSTQESLSSAPGGYNLYHIPNNMSSTNQQQDGLLIIDDDEVAFEAADVVAWKEVQEMFPYLSGNGASPQQPTVNNSNNDDEPSDLLQTARKVANLTLQEEKEKANQLKRARQLYFLQALERKRNRIEARRKAKEDATVQMSAKKEYDDTVSSAREEIDQWRAQQWDKWERACEKMSNVNDAKPYAKLLPETSPESNKNIQDTYLATNHELSAEEKEARAAAKKKAKKQKAKERAKEKKRLQRLEDEKKERALVLQKEKDASKKKCGSCGQGILGFGFEKVCQVCVVDLRIAS